MTPSSSEHAGRTGAPFERKPWKYKGKADEFNRSHRYGRYGPAYITFLERQMGDATLPAMQRFMAGMQRFAWGHLSDVAVDCMPALESEDPKPRPLTQVEFARRTGMSTGAVSQCAALCRAAGYLRADHRDLYLEDQRLISASQTSGSESVNFPAVCPTSVIGKANRVDENLGAVHPDPVNNLSPYLLSRDAYFGAHPEFEKEMQCHRAEAERHREIARKEMAEVKRMDLVLLANFRREQRRGSKAGQSEHEGTAVGSDSVNESRRLGSDCANNSFTASVQNVHYIPIETHDVPTPDASNRPAISVDAQSHLNVLTLEEINMEVIIGRSVPLLTDRPTDEGHLSESFKPKTNSPAGESQLANAEANSEEALLTIEGRIPEADTPAGFWTGVVAANPDREALISKAREQLRKARAQGLGIEQISSPDRAITVQILEAFQSYDDFQEWLRDTGSRRLARKARSSPWALYLTDAKNHAEDIALRREAKKKRKIDHEIAHERHQAAEAAAVAERDRPLPPLKAFGQIQTRVAVLPRVLKARLMRTGEWISPNALETEARNWKRCPDCQDHGMTGNAIDKTLAFCGCKAGVEEMCNKGTNWPALEMARVHADAKSLLAAACDAVGCPFAKDGIVDSEVSDDGRVLEIHLTDKHFGIDSGDIRKAAERLKWQRQIVITQGRQEPQPASAAKPGTAVPPRPPITQADIDVELTKLRQKIAPQMDA